MAEHRLTVGTVYIVGAGPGDPGLLTLRAAELLAQADVVAYDRLANPEFLKLAPRAELIDVGKRPGQSAEGQAHISEVLLDNARAGRMVVRLKGGDPFVFGRGGEEAELLASNDIPFEIVPGVTSAIAAPAYAGIPLTHRDHASWAVLATGHEDPTKDGSALDWDALSKAPTAVFLMGVERIDSITTNLLGAGRAADTPVAIVASGTWPHQRVLRSTLEKVARAVADENVEPPAILVVGGVAELADRLDWFGRRPLSGRRVFVTRTRAQAGKLSTALRDLGAIPVEFPAIKIVDPTSWDALDAALGQLNGYEWVTFASANAVEGMWSRLGPRDARTFAGTKIAAVGPATRDALRERGIEADLVPDTFTSAAMADALGRGTERVLVAQAEDAPPAFVEILRVNGWTVDVAPAYRTVVDDSSVDAGRRALDDGVDAILFTAGSTVRSFVEMWGMPPADAIVCCIGPQTAEVAAELGVRIDAVASEHTIEGLVHALVEAVPR